MGRRDAKTIIAWVALAACFVAIILLAVRLAPCCYLTLNMDH